MYFSEILNHLKLPRHSSSAIPHCLCTSCSLFLEFLPPLPGKLLIFQVWTERSPLKHSLPNFLSHAWVFFLLDRQSILCIYIPLSQHSFYCAWWRVYRSNSPLGFKLSTYKVSFYSSVYASEYTVYTQQNAWMHIHYFLKLVKKKKN